MCMYKRYIKTALGKELLVNCGKCPACIQEKAINRANRIRMEFPDDGSKVAFFVTLTYRNQCIPYIDMLEVDKRPSYFELLKAKGENLPPVSDFKVAKVYRNVSVRWCRKDGDYNMQRVVKHERVCLGSVVLDCDLLRKSSFKYLNHQSKRRVGIVYMPDIQNFIKNLKQVLKRNFDYEKPFSFYQCSEYGPTTCRPHFHLLLFAPLEDFQLFKRAIGKAWSFDNYRKSMESCEVARNAASYVSSYVNCDSSLPLLFRESEELRPRHSYSKGFGLAKECFSLAKVLQAIDRGDLHFLSSRIKSNSIVVERVLYPAYVINRYFRKFKGFCRLTSHEIEYVSDCPARLQGFRKRLGYNDEDLRSNIVMLDNLRTNFLLAGFPVEKFCEYYAAVWSLRSSCLLGDFYAKLSRPHESFYAYDNIEDYYKNEVNAPTLDVIPFPVSCETDPNLFPENVKRDLNARYWYFLYSKDKKIRNTIYSNQGFNI